LTLARAPRAGKDVSGGWGKLRRLRKLFAAILVSLKLA
jgi:hypothetical protein